MANTGNGARDRAKKGHRLMEASSEYSQISDRKNTDKINPLTQGQELEILQSALVRCKKAGINVSVSPFYGQLQVPTVIVVLPGVDFVDGNLICGKY